MSTDTTYVSALRYRWLTPLFDPLLRLTLSENRFKRLLVAQARLAPGHRVLDLGCGTATLTIMLKEAEPGATVIGLDGDPEILGRARAKVAATGLEVGLEEGMAYAPPFPPASFDRVVSSLVFHHLTTPQKRETLCALLGLLKPGGELHVADWGKAANGLMRVAFFGVQLLDGFATTADNVAGRLPSFMAEAGFSDVEETRREATVFGTLAFYRAVRPAGGAA